MWWVALRKEDDDSQSMQVLLWFTEGGAENTDNNIIPPPPPSLLFVFLHKAKSVNRLHFLLHPIFISFQCERWQVQEIIRRYFWASNNCNYCNCCWPRNTLGTRGVSRARQEFSVLAKGWHIFGRRVTIMTWQKPETVLEKSLAPRVAQKKNWGKSSVL